MYPRSLIDAVINGKVAVGLQRIWDKTKWEDSQNKELKNMLISENVPFLRGPLAKF